MIIMSTVCLHNFLLDFQNNVVNRPYGMDQTENINRVHNNYEAVNEVGVNGVNALTLRMNLTNYFVSP